MKKANNKINTPKGKSKKKLIFIVLGIFEGVRFNNEQ